MKKWLMPISCIALAATLAACGYGTRTGPHTQNVVNKGTTTQTKTQTGVGTYGQSTTNQYQTTGTQQAASFDVNMADRLVKAAKSVPGVERATAVVSGNDAVVGIQQRIPANQSNQRQVVERQVRDAVRGIAPNINVRVTSDQAMLTRITRLDQTVRSHHGSTGATTGTTAYGTPGNMGYGTTYGTTGTGYGATGTGMGYGTTAGTTGAGTTGTGYGTMPGTAGTGTAGTTYGTTTGNYGMHPGAALRGATSRAGHAITSGPTTVTGNLSNAGADFTALLRDLGRTVTAPFR